MIITKSWINSFYPDDQIGEFKSKTIDLADFVIEKITALKDSGKLLSAALFIALVPYGVKIVNAPAYETQIKFSAKTPYALQAPNRRANIVIGESEFEKAQRMQQEAAAQTNAKISVSNTPHNDPSDFDSIYKAAGAQYNVPWQILKAVHYVESGCSGSTNRSSYAGAIGPMQFMPGTWRAYGIDGNNDGSRDACNVVDAIYGAANLLAHNGAASGDIDGALFSYNHSQHYVNTVKEVAASII